MNFSNLKQHISSWWSGRIYGTRPGEDAPYIGFVYTKSAIRAKKIVSYIQKEHEFLIGTILTIVGIYVAIAAL